MASGLTLKKQNACLHAVRHAVGKKIACIHGLRSEGVKGPWFDHSNRGDLNIVAIFWRRSRSLLKITRVRSNYLTRIAFTRLGFAII